MWVGIGIGSGAPADQNRRCMRHRTQPSQRTRRVGHSFHWWLLGDQKTLVSTTKVDAFRPSPLECARRFAPAIPEGLGFHL